MTKMNMATKFAEVVKALRGEETVLTVDEMVEFVESRIEVLNNKANNKKSSKNQEANGYIKTDILNVLSENDEGMTASAILKALKVKDAETYEDTSNQKVSALLRQLVLDEKVAKVKDKKTSIFSLA